MLARVLIAQGEMDKASGLLARLRDDAEIGGRKGDLIEILALQALSLQNQEDTDQALTTLEKALALAEPEGYIRVFVDEGPPMARLLYEAVTRGIAGHGTVAQSLVACWQHSPSLNQSKLSRQKLQSPNPSWLSP